MRRVLGLTEASGDRCPGLTLGLAEFVASHPASLLPDAAVDATVRAFTNWIGCALGAHAEPAVQALRRVVLARGASGDAALIGCDERTDAAGAALVNGMAGNALDFDDMHVPTLIHPCATVAPAAFALAQARHRSGSDMVSALAVGIEVACRLGVSLFPAHYNAGWHASATLGTLGAAAAGSVLLGLSVERSAHALGIAATSAGGLRAMLSNDCKSFNLARAASAGVEAALLAEAGLDSCVDVLEARHGLLDVFGWPAEPCSMFADCGKPYLVCATSLKPYPCGVVIHPMLDACLALAATRELPTERILRVELHLNPRALDLAGRRHPENALTGRFSVYHAAALAFEYAQASLDTFEKVAVDAPSLHALRDRIEALADASLSPGAARVSVLRDDGRMFEQRVDQPSGSPARPLSDAQLQTKFSGLSGRRMDAADGQRLYQACGRVIFLDDVSKLLQA